MGDPYSPGYGAPRRPVNGMAIASLVLGVTSILMCWCATGIPAIITGHMAMAQIRRTGEDGQGLAIAGLVLGYVTTVIALLGVVFYLLFFVLVIGGAAVSGG
jgi:hypothetical protein